MVSLDVEGKISLFNQLFKIKDPGQLYLFKIVS
jgi:hypothetical protein